MTHLLKHFVFIANIIIYAEASEGHLLVETSFLQ